MLNLARRAYRSVYHAAGQAYGGPQVSVLRRHKNAALKPLRRLANRGCFPINIRASIGLGGCLMHVLNLIDFAERHRLRPVIRMTGNLYRPAESRERSWFDAYFIDRDTAAVPAKLWFLTVRRHSDYAAYATGPELSIPRAAYLLDRYIGIRPEIVARAERFIADELPGAYIAVHLRATDKTVEAAGFEQQAVEAAIARVDRRHRYDSIFLATDSADAERWFRTRFADKRIVVYGTPIDQRAPGPVHLSDMDGREKATEALVLMLIMASAQVCVRTSSLMSAFAAILNPALEIIMLNKPYAENYHFPDRQLWESCALAGDAQPAAAGAL